MADLRGVREGLGLAAAAVGGERAWRVDGVAVGLERPELGGLGEGAPADAADAGGEALPGSAPSQSRTKVEPSTLQTPFP